MDSKKKYALGNGGDHTSPKNNNFCSGKFFDWIKYPNQTNSTPTI